MTDIFQKILLFSLIPVLAMIIGGVISLIKRPTKNFRSLVLYFTAGVVFSVVSLDLLPIVIKFRLPIQTIIGFTLGFLTMIGIKKLIEANAEKKKNIKQGKLPFSLLVAVAVDIFLDGLLIGIGFSAGKEEGMLLAFALSGALLSLGMATASDLMENKISKSKSIIIIIILALIFFLSAVLGGIFLQNLSPNILGFILSFGVGVLLFLAAEELLVEAHEESETVWHSSAFFIGFLLFMVLEIYV